MALCLASVAHAEFVNFESGQVRPLALSPDGGRLFAVNTPDNRLEILTVTAEGLRPEASVEVGLEPVAVALHTAGEVWVVNHLSDSISVVDVAAAPPRVVRTLLVGDEPRDIVFAGVDGHRAFITTAHRGQNSPIDPQFLAPRVGRADVWVFDALDPGDALGGEPLTILSLFGDTPRALAVAPDRKTVYAAVFHSGNQTTTVPHVNVCDGRADEPCEVTGLTMPGGLPGPEANLQGVPRPKTGLIVKFNPDTGAWEDELARDWNNAIRFSLPDKDVFAIDATADPPAELGAYAHVGTVIYNLAVNPVSGVVYASNTEARNEKRFAGLGLSGAGTVRGHTHESRITVIGSAGVEPRHLNKHIDYAVVPSPGGVKPRTLSMPTGMAVSGDGTTLYVAALGSDKIGVFNTAELEDDTFVPDSATHIRLRGGGPTGVVLDDARGRLYTMTRFDNAVSVIDTAGRRELQHVRLFSPEPAGVVRGRRFLYDATYTSSNGESACASCHVFGHFDSLAWDLGDPDAPVLSDPNPSGGDKPLAELPDFHPMKGPMVTQTLRGLASRGPMHWRGDKTAAFDGLDPSDAHAAFMQFQSTFVEVNGRATPISTAEMEALAEFALHIVPPPNPVRALDNALTAAQQTARDQYFMEGNCAQCHVLDPARGFYGTDGRMQSNDASPQIMKIAHLENAYEKVGLNVDPAFFSDGDTSFQGDQVRGFGFLSQGALGLPGVGIAVFDYVLAFETVLAPVVGQQITLTADNASVVAPRIDLFIARAAQSECDLTVKGVVDGEPRGWLWNGFGLFRGDRGAERWISDPALRALAQEPGQALTYTCVPPGSGERIGLDRDDDGIFDADDPVLDPVIPPDPCPGDCDDDGLVSINELIRAVTVADGQNPLASCANADSTPDGAVGIAELVRAVNAALLGC